MSRPSGSSSTIPMTLQELQKLCGDKFQGKIAVGRTFLKGIGVEVPKCESKNTKKSKSAAKKKTPKQEPASRPRKNLF